MRDRPNYRLSLYVPYDIDQWLRALAEANKTSISAEAVRLLNLGLVLERGGGDVEDETTQEWAAE